MILKTSFPMSEIALSLSRKALEQRLFQNDHTHAHASFPLPLSFSSSVAAFEVSA